MKIIKFNEPTSIQIFKEEDLQKEYNLYGFYYKNKNYAQNVEEFADFDGEEDDFCYDDSRGNYQHGKPQELIKYDDEEWLTDIEGFFDEDGEPVGVEDLTEYYVFNEYWDGSNWRKQYVEADFVDADDLTEELEAGYNAKKWIGRTEEKTGTWKEFYFDGERIWQKNVTLWQGSVTDWTIWEDADDIDTIFVAYGEDWIKELRPDIYDRYGENIEVKAIEYQGIPEFEYELSPSQIFDIVTTETA